MRPLLLALHLLAGCAPPSPSSAGEAGDDSAGTGVDDPGGSDADTTWEALRSEIDASTLSDATVLFGTADGVVFEHHKGDADADSVYLAASASKWLAAITVLRLVEAGALSLDDHPQRHLDWWATDPADPRSTVTLEQLLSFTSGLSGGVDSVPCVEDGQSTLDACAREISEGLFAHEPGSTFFYGPSHLQVAGAVASAQQGQRWNRIFRQQVADPLDLAVTTAFATPSLDNPRVAGGATISARDYGRVLTALADGSLLTDESIEVMARDHTPDGVVMSNVPAAASDGRSWHYALGCWRQCDSAEWSEACDEAAVLSSPGAFGFYPMWDPADGIWGVIATHHPDGASATVDMGLRWLDTARDALGG